MVSHLKRVAQVLLVVSVFLSTVAHGKRFYAIRSFARPNAFPTRVLPKHKTGLASVRSCGTIVQFSFVAPGKRPALALPGYSDASAGRKVALPRAKIEYAMAQTTCSCNLTNLVNHFRQASCTAVTQYI